MTKVEIHFDLERPLTAAECDRIAAAYSIYGMQRLTPSADSTTLAVEYDASRLTVADVEATLRRAGVPARLSQPKPV